MKITALGATKLYYGANFAPWEKGRYGTHLVWR